MIHLKIFFGYNSERNFSYLIHTHNQAWVIDPFDPNPIIDYIKKNNLNLQGILNTHQHWDHIKGNQELKMKFGLDPLILKDQDKILLDQDNFIQVINSPGHTMEHQLFLWEQKGQKVGLFSGDTVFNSGVGNCKNGGKPEVLFETVQKIRKLPPEIIIYPGHDYAKRNLQFALSIEPSNLDIREYLLKVDQVETEKGLNWTLGDEYKFNPFFRLNSPEIRQKLNLNTLDDSHNTVRDVFLALRKLRDNW